MSLVEGGESAAECGVGDVDQTLLSSWGAGQIPLGLRAQGVLDGQLAQVEQDLQHKIEDSHQ